MKWVTVDKKYYFLRDAALASAPAGIELDGAAYVHSWLDRGEQEGETARAPELDPTRAELTGPDAHDSAARILDAWCRLHEGRAYEVTYRTPGVLYLITPRLRMNLPTQEIRRIVLEAGTESPTLLIDTNSAVIMLGMDTAELSLIPSDADPRP